MKRERAALAGRGKLGSATRKSVPVLHFLYLLSAAHNTMLQS